MNVAFFQRDWQFANASRCPASRSTDLRRMKTSDPAPTTGSFGATRGFTGKYGLPSAVAAPADTLDHIVQCSRVVGVGDGRESSMTPKNVLVVESSYISQELMKAVLASDQRLVLTANDAVQALLITEVSSIDLVLLSMRLRGMDGCELARELKSRARTQHVPIVAVSGSDSQTDMIRAREAGVLWWVRKPVNVATLRVIVASLLERDTPSDIGIPLVEGEHGPRGSVLHLQQPLQELAPTD